MAVANVQIKSGTADDTTSISITPDSNVTSGNLLIIYAMKYAPSDTDNFVVGDLAKTAGTSTIGTITMDIETDYAPGGGGFAAVYSAPVTGTGTITLTLSSISGSWFFVAVQEVSGADTSASRVAGTSFDDDDNTSPYDSGTVALTGGGIFAGCIATLSGGNITFTQDAAFTLAAEQESVDHMTGAAAYRIVTGSTTDSATWTTDTNDGAAIALAVYKEGAAAAPTVNKSESITLGESQSAAVSAPQVNRNEAVNVGESTVVSIVGTDLAVSVSDGVTVGESISLDILLTVAVDDDITLIEPTFFGFESLEVNESESITVSESHAEAVSSPQVNVSDAVGAAESHAELVTSFVGVSDSVTVTESAAAVLPDALEVNANDGVTAGESATVALTALTVDVNDTVTLTQNIAAVLPDALEVDVSDGVTIGESASVNLPIAGTYTVNVNESITLTENAAAEVGAPQVSVADAVNLTESVGAEVGSPQVNVSDAVAIGEGVTVFVNEAGALGVNVSDGASLAEAVVLAMGTLAIAAQENVALSEAGGPSMIGGRARVTHYTEGTASYVTERRKDDIL